MFRRPPALWYNEQRTPEEIRAYWLDAEAIVKRNVLRFENTAYYGEAFPLVNFDLGVVFMRGTLPARAITSVKAYGLSQQSLT